MSDAYHAYKAAEIARCGPRLADRDIALLDLIQEEAAEVIQARSKLRRSDERPGFRKMSDQDGPDTGQRLGGEVFDFLTLVDLAFNRGLLNREDYPAHKLAKLEKLRVFSPEIF